MNSYNIVQQYFHFHKILKTRLNIYGYKPTLQVGEQRVRASGRCQFCDRQRDRKTKKVCTNCAKLICRDHLVESNTKMKIFTPRDGIGTHNPRDQLKGGILLYYFHFLPRPIQILPYLPVLCRRLLAVPKFSLLW
ncbi:piggyBac transposable element-derived protein 1-like [Aphis craccivora]|uniref:PiggyBac transposable element-derived protein 1-like n=1 Tax=Aphis craccivora TaxID=307492 RepID=A0A6G0VMT9_APHCR|nr:piggyBac transposable element-derived protein 1-like [Aphis craccivora]